MNDRYPEEILGEDDDCGTMPENVAKLADSIVGHRIVKIEQGQEFTDQWGSWKRNATTLTLDNGKTVLLVDTDDCCAYTQMDDVILHLDRIDHAIMGVGTTGGYRTWHIYADLGDVAELKVGWSCGNPFYYGYGFDIVVNGAPEPLP